MRKAAPPGASPPLRSVLHNSLPEFHGSDPFLHLQLRISFVNRYITVDTFKLTGGLSVIRRSATLYFDRVHICIPVISEDRFFASVNDLTVEPNAETAILALCIHMATQLPQSNDAEHLRTSLYTTIKMHLAILEACGIISLSMVRLVFFSASTSLERAF